MRIFSGFNRKKADAKVATAGSAAPSSREQPFNVQHGHWQLSVLIDSATYAVFAASANVAPINFLNENFMDTFHCYDATYPHHRDSLPLTLEGGSLAHWSWNPATRKFTRTHADILTDELRGRSRLAMEKMNAVSIMMLYLSRARAAVRTGVEMQEIVYAAKASQARDFRSTGYDEEKIMDYPYIFQYADFAGLTYKETADEIILRAKLDQDIFAKTEVIRIAYFDLLKKVSDLKMIPPLLEAFYREAFINANI